MADSHSCNLLISMSKSSNLFTLSVRSRSSVVPLQNSLGGGAFLPQHFAPMSDILAKPTASMVLPQLAAVQPQQGKAQLRYAAVEPGTPDSADARSHTGRQHQQAHLGLGFRRQSESACPVGHSTIAAPKIHHRRTACAQTHTQFSPGVASATSAGSQTAHTTPKRTSAVAAEIGLPPIPKAKTAQRPTLPLAVASASLCQGKATTSGNVSQADSKHATSGGKPKRKAAAGIQARPLPDWNSNASVLYADPVSLKDQELAMQKQAAKSIRQTQNSFRTRKYTKPVGHSEAGARTEATAVDSRNLDSAQSPLRPGKLHGKHGVAHEAPEAWMYKWATWQVCFLPHD